MRAERWSSWLLAALVAAFVGLGFWATGGLAAARAERRDDLRQADLTRITAVLRCVVQAGAALPMTLADLDQGTPDFCQDLGRRSDPFTNALYVYERLNEQHVRICAAFERPDLRIGYGYGDEAFDPTTGCIGVSVAQPPADAG